MILCIVGPTGVGKTKLSVELAKKYNAIIVNADATQVYKEMSIGTAKITEAEKEGVPHYLFDIVSVEDNYTVYDYQTDARKILEEYKDKNIIFVGGSGLYIKAAFYNYVFDKNPETTNNYEELTNEELYKMAKEKSQSIDIHPNNRKRLVRFLNKENTEEVDCFPLYDVTYIGLTTDREKLYEKINNRTDKMFNDGLLEEVEYLYKNHKNTKAFNTAIGYKEFIPYFENNATLEEVKETIKKNSRNYAKRQYTWFNNQMDIEWFNVDFDNFNNTIKDVINKLEK